jgi:hypothetical protein
MVLICTSARREDVRRKNKKVSVYAGLQVFKPSELEGNTVRIGALNRQFSIDN